MISDKEDGSLANGKIKPEEVAVNIDYLPEGYDLVTIAQGHRSADAAAGVVKGLSLIESSDCKACHSIEKKSIGPAYKQVALKYKDDAGATERLAKKVISGGSGVWGQVAMSAHPQFSQADATEMVKYVLSLTQEKKAVNTLPVKGSYPITIPAGEKGDGRFIVRVAYKDKGNNGIAAITAEKTMLLRSAKIQAGKADKTDNVMKYGTIIIATVTNSSIGFHNLDLTSISQVAFTANAPKAQLNAAGGVIEVHLDAPAGKLIGQTSLISPSTGGSPTNMPPPVVAKLSGVTGIHDVYFVFKNDQAPAGQSLMVLIDAEFQTAKSATSKAVGTSDATPQKSLSAKELETYAGKYKMTGLPFEYIEVTPKDGKLHMNAGGNEGELSPSQETDVFAGGNGTQLKFNRNTDQKVTTLTLKAQGMSFEGTKE